MYQYRLKKFYDAGLDPEKLPEEIRELYNTVLMGSKDDDTEELFKSNDTYFTKADIKLTDKYKKDLMMALPKDSPMRILYEKEREAEEKEQKEYEKTAKGIIAKYHREKKTISGTEIVRTGLVKPFVANYCFLPRKITFENYIIECSNWWLWFINSKTANYKITKITNGKE